MARVAFFVDGFNLYHSIAKVPRYRAYKWLDIDKLCRSFLSRRDELTKIVYFTALAHWNPEKVRRHKTYIKALQTRSIQPIYGAFRLVDKRCRAECKKAYKTFEEKQTDVNMAVHLLASAINDEYDKAIILSGDSDLIPAIRTVQKSFPNKSIGILIPIGGRALELKEIVDQHSRIKERHLWQARFPEKVSIGGGGIIECPAEWTESVDGSGTTGST